MTNIEYEEIELPNGFMRLPILYCPDCKSKLWISRMDDSIARCGNCNITYDADWLESNNT